MHRRPLIAAGCALLLASCASHEGVYTPDCIAYAGDRIELKDGRFTWDKFTDEIRVDDEGRKIDRWPDYPVRGSYRREGERVLLAPEKGIELPELYLVQRNGRQYLLTADQYRQHEATGDLANCALMLGDRADR